MRLELTTLEYPKDASPGERVELVREHLLAAAVVVESSGADQIFGLGVDDGQPFSSLVESWLDSYPDNDQAWLDSLAEQIEAFFRRRFPALREVRLPEVQGSRSVVPVVTDMLSDPQREERQFDVEFYDIHPLSPPIRGIMIDRGEIYSRRMEADGTQSLADIRRDMKAKNIHRLPVFDDGWRALYMVHRSVISEFLLDSDGADLTLNDLLGRPGAEDSLGGSFAFCSPDTTVEQAREDLAAIEGARDVFVTASGNRSEPVLGMVANTDLERSA
jgi:CBS domain-containing protein